MLILNSSLMVYSGFRFTHAAARRGILIVAVNLGRTRISARRPVERPARRDVDQVEHRILQGRGGCRVQGASRVGSLSRSPTNPLAKTPAVAGGGFMFSD
jgi:hypothetical protein